MIKPHFWKRRLVSSRMTINQHVPWPIKFAFIAAVIGVGGAIAMWTYDMGRSFAFGPKFSPEQMTALQDKVASLTEERDKLLATATTIESQQNIEKATQKQLSDQISALSAENNRIKEDLAFFESLMPSANRPQGLTLQKTKVEMAGANQLRYRTSVKSVQMTVLEKGELRAKQSVSL
ncbi:MAG: hypothetical protein HYR92_03645 [Burkholderiales bacterium]|nr:hypothetical protein [Burkholderiales bacterium]